MKFRLGNLEINFDGLGLLVALMIICGTLSAIFGPT